MAALDIGRLRGDLEPFTGELEEEVYQNQSGLKDELSTAPIFDKYSHLFSDEAIDILRHAAEATPEGEDSRWLRYIRLFSTMGYLDNAVKALTDKSNTFQSQAVVELLGEKIPYRAVAVKLRNEPDHDRRRELFEAQLVVKEELNKIFLERMATAHDLSAVLQFKNYHDLCSSLKGVEYRALEIQMEELLRRTEKPYLEAMDELLMRTEGLSLSEAWSYDVPFALRGLEYDKHFPKERIAESLFSTLRPMGLDPDKYPNIKYDTEERPKKSPRAFCSAIRVPSDVRLVIMPSGGFDDYQAFLHESGHAWHFGNAKADLPAEYRYLGDNSVTEAFAFLFEHLTMSKAWLKAKMGMENPDEFYRFTLVNKLMFLRRYAAKLIYELKLHNAKVSPEFGEVYRSCLQKALKFKHTEKNYLEDVDDGFYCANYIRAWILEAQLRAALEQKWGEEWFSSEKAGELLKELWSYGQKYNAEEVVKTIGYADLDIDPLIMEIERGLSEQ